jgi:hypothetical protein
MRKPFITVPDARLVLALFLVTQAVYLAMVLLTLSHLRVLAGGMEPFDLLPAGYDIGYAMRFLEAIGSEGRDYYLSRQIPLDLIYPGLFAVSYALLWLWLLARAGGGPASLRMIAWLPILAGLADYAENGLVAAMLTRFPELSTVLVTTASVLTMAKSAITVLYFVALTILLIAVGIRKFKALRG